MYKATNVLRAAAAGATAAGIIGASLMLALPAAAQTVTGYETGYTYHQGLANGSGAALMSADDQNGTTATTNTANEPADTGVSAVPAASSDGTAVSVAPAESPAVQQVYTAPVQTAAAETAAPSFFESLSPANWAGIALIALAILIGIVAIAAQPSRTRTVTRTYQRYG